MAGCLQNSLAAIFVVTLAVVFRLEFLVVLGTHIPFITFFPAVIVAALFGGLYAGLLATALSVFATAYFWMEPIGSFYVASPADMVGIGVFVISCAMISGICEAAKRTRGHLRELVEERTGELRLANKQLHRELAERKQTERESRNLADLVDSAYDAIMVCDLDGRISFWNHGAEELYGYERGEAVGEIVHDLLHTAFPEPLPEIKRRLRQEGHWEGELIHIAKNGTRIVEASRMVLRQGSNGGAHRVLEINSDITKRKQAEESMRTAKISAERSKEIAEEASRAKDRFLAVLSHELRTPLTPVMALASEWMADPALGSALQEDLQTIHRNIELEARLVDDLLDVTRIVHGKIKLNKGPADLYEIIRGAVEVCRDEIDARHVHFELRLDGKSCPLIADSTRLHQVFWNLLKNALKFTPQEGRIVVQSHREGKAKTTVEITDSGIGIATENLPRIFNPFEQVERRETGAHGGLGLGLALSKTLVEMHGGTIKVRSEGLERGATFSVTLPLREVPVKDSSEVPNTTARPLKPLRILLVEDHADTAEVLLKLLKRRGHAVQMAENIQRALELARQSAFDLLISDLGLPDGNGRDLIQKLKLAQPKILGIALSGFGTDEDIRQSLAAGFEEHLVKPVNVSALRASIQRIFECIPGLACTPK